jgi:hypothetical protein
MMITDKIKHTRAACFVCCCIAATIALTSCDDIVNYNDGYTPASQLTNTGAPQITAVYDVTDTERTNPITEGTLGQMVVLVGDNLNNVTRIAFNTVECDIAEVYTEKQQAIVRIPSRLSMEHINKIEYTTAQGTADFGFTIPFPALTISRIDNEFMWAGGDVTVYGKNFDLYDFEGGTSTVTIGGARVQPKDITSSQMTLHIPDGTPDNSEILFAWSDTDGQPVQQSLPFRPTSALLYGDFSGVQISIDGGAQVTPDVTDGYGNLHFTGSYNAWAWNTIDLSCNMVNSGADVSASSIDNLVLKFELQTATNFPVTEDTGLQFCFNWGDSYAWNPDDGLGINTLGQWQTVALPLAPMATKGISAPGSWQTLRIVFQPHTDYEADFRLANLRIAKK